MKLLQSRFKLQVSPILGVVFSIMHLGAISCVYFVAIPALIKLALIFCILTSLFIIMQFYVLLGDKEAIIEFFPKGDGEWCLIRKSEWEFPAVISHPTFVSDYLVVINFISKNRRSRILLLISKGMLPKDDFRKLKMLLRYNLG